MKLSTRLTRDEWRIIYACLQFVKAGEIDGGPLQGDTDKDTYRNCEALESAIAKLDQRNF
jgi:hypothetical protein